MQSMQSIQSMQSLQESTESRLTSLEHTMYDVHARLARSEENSQFLHVRHQVVTDALSRSLQVSLSSPSGSAYIR